MKPAEIDALTMPQLRLFFHEKRKMTMEEAEERARRIKNLRQKRK